MKDRLKRKLKVKKIAHNISNIKPKVYEMPDEYKKNLEYLAEFLHKREQAQNALPLIKGEDRATVIDVIKTLDENIEIIEKKLADEYEAYQKKMREQEDINKHINRGLVAIEELYIITKNQVPHKFEEFHNIVTKDMTEIEIQEFLDRIAIREANVKDALVTPLVVD